jgi:predicted nuclease with TOPRIM domain
MSEITEQEFLDLKEKIEEAKTKVSELTGKQEYLKNQLKEWQVRTVGEAKKKLEKMKEELKKLDISINEQASKIRKQYDV